MDLSTGGDIHEIREAILRHSPVPIGTVPIYEAISRVRRDRRPQRQNVMLEVIEEQAEQGVDYMTIHAGVLIQYLPMISQAHHRHRQPRRRDPGRSGWRIITSRISSTNASTTSARSSQKHDV